jgi:hypothetical protein
LDLEDDPDAQNQCAQGHFDFKHDATWDQPHSLISGLSGEAVASVRVAQPPGYAADRTRAAFVTQRVNITRYERCLDKLEQKRNDLCPSAAGCHDRDCLALSSPYPASG